MIIPNFTNVAIKRLTGAKTRFDFGERNQFRGNRNIPISQSETRDPLGISPMKTLGARKNRPGLTSFGGFRGHSMFGINPGIPTIGINSIGSRNAKTVSPVFDLRSWFIPTCFFRMDFGFPCQLFVFLFPDFRTPRALSLRNGRL